MRFESIAIDDSKKKSSDKSKETAEKQKLADARAKKAAKEEQKAKKAKDAEKQKRADARAKKAAKKEQTVKEEKAKKVVGHTTKQNMEIFVKSLHRKMFSIQVKRTDTILAVKEQIKDKEDIPIDQQTIILRENELEDGHTLADCNIQADSTVHLVVLSAQAESVYEPPPPRSMQITMQDLIGRTYTLDVTSHSTVSAVKDMIRLRPDYLFPGPPGLIFIDAGGHLLHLSDELTLAEYNIHNGSLVYVATGEQRGD